MKSIVLNNNIYLALFKELFFLRECFNIISLLLSLFRNAIHNFINRIY